LSFDFSLAGGAKGLFYSLGQENQIIFIYWATLARLTNAHKNFLAAKWFGSP
jgi:hypothetical protein